MFLFLSQLAKASAHGASMPPVQSGATHVPRAGGAILTTACQLHRQRLICEPQLLAQAHNGTGYLFERFPAMLRQAACVSGP